MARLMATTDDPALQSSKREAILVCLLWLVATVYSIGYCARFGYGRTLDELTFVAGIPDWVFWGIVVPWTACTAISCWFAARVMRDDPLGDDMNNESIDAS
jgi:hypothetical protein